MTHLLSPAQLAADTGYKIIDLRPWEERYKSIGFIPGSLRMEDDEALLALAQRERVALSCLSGKRSASRAAELRAHGATLWELDGGVLAWRASGLPLCDPQHPHIVDIPHIPTLAEAPRILAACFVAEQIELSLDRGDEQDIDALAELRGLFEAAGISWEAPTLAGLYIVLDQAADYSRQRGNSLESIRLNLDRYCAALAKLG
jgi:thiosulfate sulfurtransferase